MKTETFLTNRAAVRLSTLPQSDRRRLAEVIEQLSRHPTSAVSVPLGSGERGQLFMMNAGRYLLVYKVVKNVIQVLDFFIPDDFEIEPIVEFLNEQFTEYIPDELDALSSQTVIDVVEDVTISTRVPVDRGFRMIGTGSVSVELNYGGGDERDGVTNYASFPFTFELITDYDGDPQELLRVRVDTTSFYE